MKLRNAFKLAAVAAAATIGVLGSAITASSTEFDALEVDQDSFLSVAIPGGRFIPYQLWLIRERQPGAECFAVTGSDPGVVTPLWRENTSGCAPTSDSNGYSIRVGGEELGSAYALAVKESDGELVLLGQPLRGSSFVIGRTGGISENGYTEIKLAPGWRITQRTYEGTPLGHFYYTNDLTLAELETGDDIAANPVPNPDPVPQIDYPFPDIANDIYADEIVRAVEIGFVAGRQDGTFGPTRPVTREEATSMVVEALLTRGNFEIPTVTQAPFPDVPADRWSAPKIALLRQNGILAGDPSGNYRPTDTVTRAELMSILRRTAEVLASSGGVRPEEIEPTGDVVRFSDTSAHWNAETIAVMSAYCGVATPYNERGSEFRPDANALRNYTTAAVERLIDCGATPEL
ncbi:DUF3747 domain-containing protein [Oscillatoria sp. CS-180]|uniref:DUF3747 domain-containing protein n=1 Tax=Oscillatoria sp. CS-180 TaxID=3021720 RepID=UPI002330934C|nr:DUF3747 domain-containing protein [Oscillatoria sp. CS-180]MDB9525980.1 DUF3747 domain-containing protein [Oscillatoria sp. CS-180]